MTEYALDGKTARKKNNALTMEFVDVSGKVATATQSGGDGRKAKMSVLMGWRNGGPGRHSITFADGRELVLEVADGSGPAQLRDADGSVLAAITPGPPGEYRSSDGSVVLRIEADGEPSAGAVPMAIRRSSGDVLARMSDVRTNSSWTVRDSLRVATDLYMFLTASGSTSLPIKRFGTQVTSDQTPTQAELDALVAISVAICIGLKDLVPQRK